MTEQPFRIARAVIRDDLLIGELTDIWRTAVEESHFFLTTGDIAKLQEIVPDALRSIATLLIARDEQGQAIGFAGIETGKLEMLFLHPRAQGQGLGRALLEQAMEKYDVTELTVNEQNPKARGFYEHMGFTLTARSPVDAQGNPFPILHFASS